MEKKRTASIRVRDIAKVSVKRSESGNDVIDMSIKSAEYQLGYKNSSSKSRFDLISPNWNIKHWSEELNYEGHFCFVDTNSMKSTGTELPEYSHATGIYIFQLEQVKFQLDGEWTNLTWKPDWRRSVIHFAFTTGSDDDAERRGWDLALEQLTVLRAAKAKIFVDKHQNELAELSKSLPGGWDYYYVSSDRGQTLFNLIFRRLDKARNIVSASGSSNFEKVDIERYLMGNASQLRGKRR